MSHRFEKYTINTGLQKNSLQVQANSLLKYITRLLKHTNSLQEYLNMYELQSIRCEEQKTLTDIFSDMEKITLNVLDLFLNRFKVLVSSLGLYALGIDL
jgi:hypothetical protein